MKSGIQIMIEIANQKPTTAGKIDLIMKLMEPIPIVSELANGEEIIIGYDNLVLGRDDVMKILDENPSSGPILSSEQSNLKELEDEQKENGPRE